MWLFNFLLTILIELPVYALLLKPKLGFSNTLLYVVLINGFTHPLATFLYNGLEMDFYAVELSVWIAEALGLMFFIFKDEVWNKISLLKSCGIALAANLASAGAGKIMELLDGMF